MSNNGKSITSQSDNPLARALARWENEGGATISAEQDDDGRVMLSQAEQRILQCLGAAVIAQWAELPTDIKKALFEHAVSSGDPRHSVNCESRSPAFYIITRTRPSVLSRKTRIATARHGGLATLLKRMEGRTTITSIVTSNMAKNIWTLPPH